MTIYIQLLAILPILLLSYQFYLFTSHSEGKVKQRRCERLGIAYMTIGITILAFRTLPSVILGLIMIMFGFRLMAKGLDRLDKKIYLDQYEGDK